MLQDTPTLLAVITVGASGVVGYCIYWLATRRRSSSSAVMLGRRWFGWFAIVCTFALLPPFFRTFNINSLAIWMANLFAIGAVVFLVGWGIGRFRVVKFKPQPPMPSSSPDAALEQVQSESEQRHNADGNSRRPSPNWPVLGSALVVGIAIAVGIAAFTPQLSSPSSYNECLLQTLKQTQNTFAADELRKACARRFPRTVPAGCPRRRLLNAIV